MRSLPSRIDDASSERPAERLSDRQRDCLALAAEGLTSRVIGRRLGISGRTVDEHVMLACQALGVRTRIQAVARLAATGSCAEAKSFLP